MAGTRIWRVSAGGAPGRSGSVPLCVPEGQLVSSGLIVAGQFCIDALFGRGAPLRVRLYSLALTGPLKRASR
jgi:hypothetical protein